MVLRFVKRGLNNHTSKVLNDLKESMHVCVIAKLEFLVSGQFLHFQVWHTLTRVVYEQE